MQNKTILLNLLIYTSLFAAQPIADHKDYSHISKTEIQSKSKSGNKGFIKNHPKTCAALTVLTVLGGVLGCRFVVRKKNIQQAQRDTQCREELSRRDQEQLKESQRRSAEYKAKLEQEFADLRITFAQQKAERAKNYEEEKAQLARAREQRQLESRLNMERIQRDAEEHQKRAEAARRNAEETRVRLELEIVQFREKDEERIRRLELEISKMEAPCMAQTAGKTPD